MAIVNWSDRAVKNLKTIKDYIAMDSAFYAKKFTKELIKTTDSQLKAFPNSGKKVEEFENSIFHHLRQLTFNSYRIVYEFEEAIDTVTILAVIRSNPLNSSTLED